MRSTIQISANTTLNNLLDNYSKILRIQNQMARGRRVINPSDDPLAANVGMRLDTFMHRIKQYDRNVGSAESFLGLSDAALSDVSDIVNKAKSLTLGSASDTTTPQMRKANATEANNLLQELVSIGNRKDGLRYIFGGTETRRAALEVVGGRYVRYRGNNKEIQVQTDAASFLAMNVTGEAVFGTMVSKIASRDLSPDVNLDLDRATRLETLNQGQGIPKGSINILYSAYAQTGLDIDLSSADTLEDIRDIIEKESYGASQDLPLVDPNRERYIRVEINPNHDGIQLFEADATGGFPGVPTDLAIEVREVGGNTVAANLGILASSAQSWDPVWAPFHGLPTFHRIVGRDVNPALSERTLLADLRGWDDSALEIVNGSLPEDIRILEKNDTNNLTDQWQVRGLQKGVNTGPNGELYVRAVRTVAAPSSVDVEIYRVPVSEATQADLVATGVSATGTGMVTLQEANSSGISGLVGLNYTDAAPSQYTVDMDALFDQPFRATVQVNAFTEEDTATGAADDAFGQLDGWHLRGIRSEQLTDPQGRLFVRVSTAGNDRIVELFRDSAAGAADLVATGTLRGNGAPAFRGQVTFTGEAANGFGDVRGTVDLNWVADDPGAGALTTAVTPTFKTVGDLMNAVKASNTYTTARIASGGRLEILSDLAGATLSVGETQTGLPAFGDDAGPGGAPQLRDLTLSGLTKGPGVKEVWERDPVTGLKTRFFKNVNTDSLGNVYAEVVDNGFPPPAGQFRYEVNIYRDRAKQVIDPVTGNMTSTLVASGGSDIPNPVGPILITERNHSGLSGSVEMNYTADDDLIEVIPGGYRVEGASRTRIEQVSATGIIPGFNADYDGSLYAKVDTAAGLIRVYRSAGRTDATEVARAALPGAPGFVALAQMNASGLGTVANPFTLWIDPQESDDDIVIRQGALRETGQKRESNIFATLNDVIDAMHANDSDELHNLIGNYETDLNRVLMGRADVGNRQDRLLLIRERHEDESVNFGKIRSEAIDLDFSKAVVDFQSQQNVFEASLRVAAQVVPMSLVDFI